MGGGGAVSGQGGVAIKREWTRRSTAECSRKNSLPVGDEVKEDLSR